MSIMAPAKVAQWAGTLGSNGDPLTMNVNDSVPQNQVEPIEVLAPDDMAAADDDWAALVEIMAEILKRRVREKAPSQDQADTRAAK